MPANDRSMWTGSATVTAATYTVATPNLDGSTYCTGGCWSIYNPSATRTVIASQNGVDDAFTVPPGCAYTTPNSNLSGKLWLRLDSAGSVSVTGNLTARKVVD
jgi:hypothetical protein